MDRGRFPPPGSGRRSGGGRSRRARPPGRRGVPACRLGDRRCPGGGAGRPRSRRRARPPGTRRRSLPREARSSSPGEGSHYPADACVERSAASAVGSPTCSTRCTTEGTDRASSTCSVRLTRSPARPSRPRPTCWRSEAISMYHRSPGIRRTRDCQTCRPADMSTSIAHRHRRRVRRQACLRGPR